MIATRSEYSNQASAPRAKTTNLITILIADDHNILREGLRALLEAAPGFTVVGQAATGREAVETAKRLQPSVVVMDIAMPQLNGIEACRQIIASAPDSKVILLSGYSDDEFIERAAEVGAAGYVVKHNSAESLVHAIREVVRGKRFFSRPIAKRMSAEGLRSTGANSQAPASACLTSRQQEVLQLVAEGAPNKQVAASLGISIKTVEKHRQHLMEKLDIHDIAGLTRYAIATRLIESSVTVTVI